MGSMHSPYRRVAPIPQDRARTSSTSSSQGEKKGYRVIKESVLQERQKLNAKVVYTKTPPDGYTFVPVGSPEITDECREIARKRGLPVFIVSDAKPRQRSEREKISEHIHRIGYHFPHKVLDEALKKIGLNLQPGGQPRRIPSYLPGINAFAQHITAQQTRVGGGSSAPMSDGQHRQSVSAAIKELFPLIPDDDREAIVQRAFEKGANTVGNSNLPMSRKVQLATLAHIRHTHTDYDGLLKPFGWTAARQMIEDICLEKIKLWRGEKKDDGDGDVVELEQILREVIVLDDESDDDNDAEPPHSAVTAPARIGGPSASSRQNTKRRRRSHSSSLELIDAHQYPDSGADRLQRSRPGSQPEKRVKVARPNFSPRAIHRSYEQEPPVIRPSNTQLVQPRPVRGPQPAQIHHLDEVSRQISPATPFQPESYGRPQRDSYIDRNRHSYAGEPYALPHREPRPVQPADNLNALRVRYYGEGGGRERDARPYERDVGRLPFPRPVVARTIEPVQPRPIRRAHPIIYDLTDE